MKIGFQFGLGQNSGEADGFAQGCGQENEKIKCFAQNHFEKGSTGRKMGKMRKYVEIFARICGQGSKIRIDIIQIRDIPIPLKQFLCTIKSNVQ